MFPKTTSRVLLKKEINLCDFNPICAISNHDYHFSRRLRRWEEQKTWIFVSGKKMCLMWRRRTMYLLDKYLMGTIFFFLLSYCYYMYFAKKFLLFDSGNGMDEEKDSTLPFSPYFIIIIINKISSFIFIKKIYKKIMFFIQILFF